MSSAGIPTVRSLASNSRHLDRSNKRVEHVAELMRGGAALHATRRTGKSTYWSLSTGIAVHEDVARLVIMRSDIVGVGDCLFGRELSQTFRFVDR